MTSGTGTRVLVTGANRGIGLALVQRLLARGDEVLAVCRRTSSALARTGATVIEGVEMTDEDAVTGLPDRLGPNRLDVVYANAGILLPDDLDGFAADDLRAQFEVNALGPLRLVRAVLPRLAAPAKVALITSRMGSIADNTSGGYCGYRMSKAALNAAGVSLAHDVRARGVAVAILHPGYVKTDMTSHHGTVEPDNAAAQLVARVDALTLETSGRFFHANGDPLPW